ncbi:MAG: GCN5 family acetyltransferase [Gammaproteobacteria bacterium BRH_c0]|nr:MAG: GCN5 family acetyltransferase [Gammaproteobacteria bacterium BRH_c0]
MTNPNPTIRPATRQEINLALDWAAAEGWNPGICDAVPFHAADPEGFLVGLVDDEPVAVISAVKYGTTFGFIGFYIVRPDVRGLGYGWAIWQAAMARLANRQIGLDGVVDQQDNYRKSGFRLAHRNVRYQGVGGAGEHSKPAPGECVPLPSLPFNEVAEYDKGFFPTLRAEFLHHWIAQPQTEALGFLVDGRIAGYAVMRPCRNGHKIGPLFADTATGAERLFVALAAHAPEGSPVFLDVPECNPAAVELAHRYGMAVVFETARMYTGSAPDIAIDRTYGITSFELG